MKRFKSIILVFENCEQAIIPIQYVRDFGFSCKESSISAVRSKGELGLLETPLITEGYITFSPEAADISIFWLGEKRSLKERLQTWADITQIHFCSKLKPSRSKSYFIDWTAPTDQDTNADQHLFVSSDNFITIYFGRDEEQLADLASEGEL